MGSASLMIETVKWDEKAELETVVIAKAGMEFVVFDSAYGTRLPIIMSSETTLKLLGQEYLAPPLKMDITSLLLTRLRRVFGISEFKPVTLKSPTLLPSEGADHGGQLLFIFAAERSKIDISSAQEALNTHAQDIHNSYGARMWGDLTMSLARLIARCA